MEKSFRRSRVAMILDILLIPLIIPLAILREGVPSTIRAFRSYYGAFFKTWKTRGWFKGE